VILTALKDLAEGEGLVADPDYEPKEVHYLVRIGCDGRIAGFNSTLSAPTGGRGKPRPKKMRVPRHSGRTSGAVAEFLCDKAEYVFGVDPAGKRRLAELKKRRALFLDKIRACAAATGDEGVKALLSALESGPGVCLPEDVAANSLFAFIYEPDVDRLISDRERVRDYWHGLRRQPAGEGIDNGSQCLITGDRCIPTRKHPPLKRVPGATSSGAALISFNANAFESYGLRRNENAPISRPAAEAYTTALNRLLDPAYPSPLDGTPLPRRRVRLNDSTIAVFWSRETSDFVDLFADIEADPRAVLSVIKAPYVGRKPVLEDPQAFYAAILSGAQGRVILREWIETTVGDVARNVKDHFDDLAIIRPREEGAPQPLWLLLRSMAVLGKKENISPGLAADFFAAILRGTRYPRALLDTSVRRMRGEQDVPQERAALIKAYLARARRLGRASNIPEVTMSLDEKSSNVPYRLGRLFAVLERLQEAAIHPSATIRDRFFGAASANPVTVFPRLLRGAQPHISKVGGGFFQKMIGEIVDGLPARGFPATLTLEEQGLFAIGYYHQRQAFFTKGPVAPQSDATPPH
jgi:CRISPR-associated protein Csd1